MQALGFGLFALTIFAASIAAPLAVAHPGQPGEPPPDEAPFPGEFDRDNFEWFDEGAGVSLFMGDRKPLFMFGAMDVDFNWGNISERIQMRERMWDRGFDPGERAFHFDTNITSAVAGPAMNRTHISLMFKPVIDENMRRIEYNATLAENLTMDSLSIRWSLDTLPEEMGHEFPGEFPDWGWSKRPDHLALNDPEGRNMARLHWLDRATISRNGSLDFLPVRTENETLGENITLTMTLDVGSRTDTIRAGGYLDFLDDFITVLKAGSEEVSDMVRDHIVSFAVAAVVCTVVLGGSLAYANNRRGREDPDRDLDYRKSKYYRI